MTESIYNLIPKPKKAKPKPSMYRSKYDPKSSLVGSTFGLHGTTVTVGRGVDELKKTRSISSTFGPSKQSDSTPSNFLRKGSGPSFSSKGSISKSRKFSRSNVNQKEAVPSRTEMPIMGLKTSKNFIKCNALEIILTEPTSKGKKEVNYLKKESYGKVPDYLHQVKDEVMKEKDLIEGIVKDKMKENTDTLQNCYEMDEEERRNLINMLKTRWDEVNQKYQKICHKTNHDTIGDIKRKETQETELKQLENDIELLSRPGPILIRQ